MDHWTSHAFHASVTSPHLMYADVTIGFAGGSVTFAGRPLRAWRTWSWAGVFARVAVLLAGGVVMTQRLLSMDLDLGLTSELAITISVIIAGTAVAIWIVAGVLRRAIRTSRAKAPERVVKLPLADISRVRLSGKTLSLSAPFDQANRSDRWRLRLDSHEEGESLMALLAHG